MKRIARISIISITVFSLSMMFSCGKTISPDNNIGASTTISAPSLDSIEPLGENTIKVKWTDNSDNENGFAVERATSEGGPFSESSQTTANITELNVTGLTANTTYYFRVRAFNETDISFYSRTNHGTTFDTGQGPVTPIVSTFVPGEITLEAGKTYSFVFTGENLNEDDREIVLANSDGVEKAYSSPTDIEYSVVDSVETLLLKNVPADDFTKLGAYKAFIRNDGINESEKYDLTVLGEIHYFPVYSTTGNAQASNALDNSFTLTAGEYIIKLDVYEYWHWYNSSNEDRFNYASQYEYSSNETQLCFNVLFNGIPFYRPQLDNDGSYILNGDGIPMPQQISYGSNKQITYNAHHPNPTDGSDPYIIPLTMTENSAVFARFYDFYDKNYTNNDGVMHFIVQRIE